MDEPKSYFEKVVCLRSWWLGISDNDFDGRQLSVAGFSNREKEARRVFISAPILKRHDEFNLETVDGISVKLHGFIDKARTEANGFSSEIFRHFLFGFPAWWEECAKKCANKECTTELITENNTGIEAASPQERGIIADGTADEDILPGCLDSSNADKDQHLSGETVLANHSSISTFEKHDAKQGEATVKPKLKKITETDLASAGKSKSATVNENSSTTDAEKKLAHVNEGTPVHDTFPIVFPDAASSRRSQSEHETADEDIVPDHLDSSYADKDEYLSGENVLSNHTSDCNIERQDAKQAQTTAKPKGHRRLKKSSQASNNSKSVKNDMTSVGKRKRRAAVNVNLSVREADKKSAQVQDAKLAGTTLKPKGHKRLKKSPKASNNSKSVKKDMTSAGKRKGSTTANVNLSGREADKKSAHVNEITPVHNKVPILSPEAASFRRSRSGRLLLPALEFWHNQRAVYDMDRKIVGVEGVSDL